MCKKRPLKNFPGGTTKKIRAHLPIGRRMAAAGKPPLPPASPVARGGAKGPIPPLSPMAWPANQAYVCFIVSRLECLLHFSTPPGRMRQRMHAVAHGKGPRPQPPAHAGPLVRVASTIGRPAQMIIHVGCDHLDHVSCKGKAAPCRPTPASPPLRRATQRRPVLHPAAPRPAAA